MGLSAYLDTVPLSSKCCRGRTGSPLKHSSGNPFNCSSVDTLVGTSSSVREKLDGVGEVAREPGRDETGVRTRLLRALARAVAAAVSSSSTAECSGTETMLLWRDKRGVVSDGGGAARFLVSNTALSSGTPAAPPGGEGRLIFLPEAEVVADGSVVCRPPDTSQRADTATTGSQADQQQGQMMDEPGEVALSVSLLVMVVTGLCVLLSKEVGSDWIFKFRSFETGTYRKYWFKIPGYS